MDATMVPTLGECLTGKDPKVPCDASVKTVINVMKEFGKGFVIIEDRGSPVGILTERDIARLLYMNASLDEPAIKHGKKPLISARATRSIYHGLDLMLENDVRRLIVVDDNGRFLGTLTITDLIKRLDKESLTRKTTIRDVLLSKSLIAVSKETSLNEAIKIMVENNVSCLPVVDDGAPVGIVTEKDVVDLSMMGVNEVRLEDFALKPVETVFLNDYLETALVKMEQKGIRHLIVVEDGVAVGVITQRDLARAIETDYSKLLEKKLRQARDILEFFPECVLDVLDLGDEQVIVWANHTARQKLGKVIDRSITDLIPEKEWAYASYKLRKEGKVERIRFSIGLQHYEISASYLKLGERGYEGRIKVVLKDVSEEIEKSKRFWEELDTLKKVMNSTEDMIIIYEAETGKFKIWNNAFQKKLGYTEEELKTKTIFEIVDIDRNTLNENIRKIITKGEIIRGKRLYRDAYNNFLPVEIVATKISIENVDNILVVARDFSERLKLEEELREKVEELEGLHEFIINLNRCSSEGEAYNLLALTLLNKMNLDLIAIYKINPSLNRVEGKLVYGNGNIEDEVEEEVSVCKVFNSPQPFLANSPRSYSCPNFRSEFSSYMCMSVHSGGRTNAVVVMVSKEENFFTAERIQYVQSLLNTFSPFLSNLRLIEINKELSIKDPLTGLYNRRFGMEFLNKELEKAKRYNKPLSLIMVDLDDFKKINDIHGHSVGDLCLKTFSEIVSKNTRSADVICRWGGEEFLIILPETQKDVAYEVVERIRSSAKINTLSIIPSRPYLTASYGIASYPEDGDSLDELIKMADDRLYVGKKSGKDLIVKE